MCSICVVRVGGAPRGLLVYSWVLLCYLTCLSVCLPRRHGRVLRGSCAEGGLGDLGIWAARDSGVGLCVSSEIGVGGKGQ
ncbi:hypothetical protein B0T26DRAFT_166740 [Lasiosphaeria miniovina]|uniref:Uncharacterized protein n=1 Tax=Lasiosphaeria miniovina TaxID=1954250 RepID=A0AA40B5W6_9PEZI|nr:uncharacterized protein B0T26DRAFT_166740 [Lasiosphaeria miniovina]KAK0728294.1 hypothetical protein B0T26DRAFT_166740 [Lasiosphaeria miniovina]